MSTSLNSNSPQLRPSQVGLKVERGIADLGTVIRRTSDLTANERSESKSDLFLSSKESKNPEDQKAYDLENVKDIAKKTGIKNSQLATKANQSAAAILLKIGLGIDPTLIEFTQKGTEGKSPEEAQQIIAKNTKEFINDPGNVKNLQIFAGKLSEKLSGDKKINASGKESSKTNNDESQELLAELESVMASGSHEEVQQLLEKLQGSNPELLKSLNLKTEIKQYQKDLVAVFHSKQRDITNAQELKKHPLYKEGVEAKGDKGLRNLLAKFAGQMIEQLGGIYNFKDTDVSWALAAFEYKPDMSGRSVADISIRRLLPEEVAGNSRTYTAHLTEDQPTYEYMNVA